MKASSHILVSIVFVATMLLIVPIFSFADGIVPCDGPDCTACHFIVLGQNILNFLVAIGAFLAALAFAFAGFKMVTSAGNAGQVEEAKGIFSNVLIGFIIMLAAWLIIDTGMKMLVDESPDSGTPTGFGPWYQLQSSSCPSTPSTTPAPTPSPAGGGGTQPPAGGGGTTPPASTGGTLTHDQAIQQLTAAGVVVTSTAGAGGVQANCSGSGCTSLTNVRADTLTVPIAIKQQCPTCNVVITAGTESGVHGDGTMSHANGYKIDIDDTASVNNFLQSTLTPAGSTSLGPKYTDSAGNVYVKESNHWDVQVKAPVTTI